MNSKPRSDAKLLNLPPEDIEKLRDALFSGMKYADACEFAAKEFGVRASRTTVCEFWKKECFPIVLARRANAIQESAEYAGEVQKTPASFDQITQDALQLRSYKIALNPDRATALALALHAGRQTPPPYCGTPLVRRRGHLHKPRHHARIYL